jgi:hypothetical protein
VPISFTPLQQQKLVTNALNNVQLGITSAHYELNHLGLGMPTADKQHEVFVGRDLPFRHETARVAKEQVYLATMLLKGTLPTLPVAMRAPGRETVASLQAATQKLNHFLATPDAEKELPHGLAAYAAVNDAFAASAKLMELVTA